MLMPNLPERELLHEIRSPLTTILGMISSLKNESLTITQQDYVDGIFQSANRLLNFANTLQPQPHANIKFCVRKNPRVLLVEDDPFIQHIDQSMLSDLGCETDVASNGQEALALAKRPYDLVMLDIGLPDISGIELAKSFKSHLNQASTRLMAITAYTDQATKNSCLAAGIEQVLHKPVTPETLNTALNFQNNSKEGLPL